MSKESLERQADRAERLADNTVDERMKQILLDAAREYREKARQGHPEGARRKADAPAWHGLGSALPEQTRGSTGF